MKPIKSQEQSDRELNSIDNMISIGFKTKDHLGQPYFLPIEGGGYCQNFSCKLTKAQFEAELRKYA